MDGYEAVVVECGEKIDQLKDYLAGGRVQSYEEYKFLCGEIKGLLHVRDYTIALKQHMEYSDNE